MLRSSRHFEFGDDMASRKAFTSLGNFSMNRGENFNVALVVVTAASCRAPLSFLKLPCILPLSRADHRQSLATKIADHPPRVFRCTTLAESSPTRAWPVWPSHYPSRTPFPPDPSSLVAERFVPLELLLPVLPSWRPPVPVRRTHLVACRPRC